ncbi:MAG: hypothetical protein JWM53_6614 [bacterium]|nr:hypothetical protein [bacterium]
MGLKHLIAVEKWTCLLAAVVLAGGLVLLPRHAAFSLAIGALLTVGNAVAIRRSAQTLGPLMQQKPAITVLLFNAKLALLIGLIFVAIYWLHVDGVPFAVGISLLPAAIFIVSIKHALAPSTTTPSTPPTTTPSDEETHG